MTRFLILSVAALLSLGLFAACSSGDSGPSCEDVCGKMQECDPTENYTECVSTCEGFSEVMRDAVYETMGDCFMDQTCAFLVENRDYCIEAAMAAGDLAASRLLVERVCAKIAACDPSGTYTEQQCIEDQTGEGEGEVSDDMYYTFAMFKDSVLDCVGDCLEEMTCTELDDASETCLNDCGLDFVK